MPTAGKNQATACSPAACSRPDWTATCPASSPRSSPTRKAASANAASPRHRAP